MDACEASAGRLRFALARGEVPAVEVLPGRCAASLRVVASEDPGSAPVDDDVRKAFRAVVARLDAAGARVIEDAPGLDSSVAAWSTIATAEARHSEAEQFEHHHAVLGEAAAEAIERLADFSARPTEPHFLEQRPC